LTLPVALIEPYEPIYTTKNNAKAPDYLRLDLGFTLNTQSKRGNEVQWNFSVYNAFGRRNPFYVQYDQSYFGDFNEETFQYINDGVKGQLNQQTVFSFLPSFSYSVKF